MTAITVYGASDDLVEVEGDIREEFNVSSDSAELLAFSDGTVLRVGYDELHDGYWRITPMFRGSAHLTVEPVASAYGRREDGKPAYSEIATLTGEIRWVVRGTAYATQRIGARE